MDLMENICAHIVRSLKIYGECLVEDEAFDPETATNARNTLAVATSRHQTRGNQGPPTGDPPTIEELSVWAEAEHLTQEAITNLSHAKASASGGQAAVAPSANPPPDSGPSGLGIPVGGAPSGGSGAPAIAAAAVPADRDESMP